ncbi:hypothetical protein R5R35_007700 [Gryllus longicercus]|uniref:Constitutive coactivator of PPAR-gamma-like protein 1 homolog n=1 Tax=Gryllus longicercus TaxID=2509291 RepID=A0AAN9VF43_9ORTH
MGVQDLQSFLDGAQVSGSSVPVDLLRIARGIAQQQARQNHRNKGSNSATNKLCLVVDGECCLDRLYGGYFSDWACGGQWNRMVQFLAVLIQTVQTSYIDLAVFFNGCLEQQRMSEWVAAQLRTRQGINQVLKHINIKGTPPPKVWWTSPVCLRTCLRMALRHLNVSVVCTMDDHHQEVIAYCRENSFHGVMADDGEYAVFDPPRYFSSKHLKLTYKGSLETKEYILAEVSKNLGLSADRFCLLAALLGNYLLTEHDLVDFYRKLGMKENPGKIPAEILVKNVANFVKSLPSVDNLDSVAFQVFGSTSDKRAAKLRQSVQYYLNGTKDGFLRYRPHHTGRRQDTGHHMGPQKSSFTVNKGTQNDAEDSSRFASETIESERDSLAAYKEATANAKAAPQIVIEPPTAGHSETIKTIHNACSGEKNHEEESSVLSGNSEPHAINGGNHAQLLISSSSSSSSSSATSPSRLTPENAKLNSVAEDVVGPVSNKLSSLPSIPPEVMRTASERHQKGLMSPFIYQILTQGEVKFPVLMEDENHKELPSIHLFYRPVRQMVYAILFNLHHHMYLATQNKKEGEVEKTEVPELRIKEWIWSKSNPYQTPEYVKAEQIGWRVPTIQRLWFGSANDDRRRRLRAFLTCMRSDTPLMLNPAYVPQHLLVMATVLRYMISFPDKKILRKPELDAFIAQAFSPELMNAHYLQELQLPLVTSRGVQLAAMFMQGVETALMANDACGAPIPWLMCCPWLFFDGKLFHHKLARTSVVKNLLELCDHHIDHVVKVDRMRKAIMEGLNVQFARPAMPQMTGMRMPGGMPPGNVQPAGGALVQSRAMPVGKCSLYTANGASRGLLRRSVPTRGGQLEIAGVVVGSWGPNYGSRVGGTPHSGPGPIVAAPRSRMVPPQVTSVGGLKNYRQNNAVSNYHMNPIPSGARPTFHTRGAKLGASVGRGKRNQGYNKKKSPSNKKLNNREIDRREAKGRGMTVEGSAGNTLPASALLNSDIGGGGDDNTKHRKEAAVAGQFDDASPSAEQVKHGDKICSSPSVRAAATSDVPISILDGVGHKGQGDGPAQSVLASVVTADN